MGKRRKGKIFPDIHLPNVMDMELDGEYTVERKLFSTTTKECEEGSKILMRNGFFLTLLNIIFGLLPVTIQGNTVTHSKCSLSTLYSLMALVCLSYASFVFVYLTLVKDLLQFNSGEQFVLGTSSDVMALVIDRGAHVIGFLSLMLRGRIMARYVPKVWFLLSKAIQNCIVNIHGTGQSYDKLRKLRRFSRRCVILYVLTLCFNEGQLIFESGMPLMVELEAEFTSAYVQLQDSWKIYLVLAGYIMWDLTTLSHVLVSLILCYFITTIYFCLRSINDELKTVLKIDHLNSSVKRSLHFNIKSKLRSKLLNGVSVIKVPMMNSSCGAGSGSGSGSGSGPTLGCGASSKYCVDYGLNGDKSSEYRNHDWNSDGDVNYEAEEMEIRLNYIKDCYGAVEDVLAALSSTWGISIFIETLVLMGTVLANSFFVLMQRYNDGVYGPYADLCIHFFFFYWLAVACTKMHNESRRPLRILMDVSYQTFSPRIQNLIRVLKSDIASTDFQLTATDYFVVSKNLMTAICGTIITFLIVLIQFKSEENQGQGFKPQTVSLVFFQFFQIMILTDPNCNS